MDEIKSFIEVTCDEEFRKYVEKRLQEYSIDKGYSFSYNFPTLFKYRPFNEFTVADLLNTDVQLSSIMEFNDSLEGNLRLVKSEEEINQTIETRWNQHCNIVALGFPYCFSYDEIKKQELKIIYRDQYNASTFLSYYGAYIGCFTEEANSILMWSHYADSSKGINVEYDFSNIKNKSILKNILFPVCYSEEPIYVGDLKKDKAERLLCKYPIDAAVLCGAINKNSAWQYEKEWRIVYLPNTSAISYSVKRIPIKKLVDYIFIPISITLGYNFLRNFFYYNSDNNSKDIANKNLKSCRSLINFIEKNAIKCFYVMPDIVSCKMERKEFDYRLLKNFLDQHFRNDASCNINSYSSYLWFWLETIRQ